MDHLFIQIIRILTEVWTTGSLGGRRTAVLGDDFERKEARRSAWWVAAILVVVIGGGWLFFRWVLSYY